jgi:hypothetical protein
MKTKLTVLFLIVYFFIPTTFAKNQIVYYEPKIVTLTGMIKFKTFPGPPNYESIEAGDDAETCPYLFLDHTVDVVVPEDDANSEDEPEKNLKVMQIAVDEETSNWSWSKNKYVGKHVRVTGTLYHSLTGHHHTRVLIDAKHFAVVPY